jgi:hypothetical protein
MAQFGELCPEVFDVSQIAGRLLIAWGSVEGAEWIRQLQSAQLCAAHVRPSSTLEMERLDVLSVALESLARQSHSSGAIRLLEQLAGPLDQNTPARGTPVQNTPVANGWPLLPGMLAVVPCSQFVQ